MGENLVTYLHGDLGSAKPVEPMHQPTQQPLHSGTDRLSYILTQVLRRRRTMEQLHRPTDHQWYRGTNVPAYSPTKLL